MLLDLIYQSLPSAKKRRYHFTTFMLDIFRRIERERISRLALSPGLGMEHVVLSLARESIAVHPILFLDEFQLPDRASSKLLSLFMTSFFHLGGVLVASSNRMPEELAKAQGVEFGVRPAKRFDWRTGYSRWTIRSPQGEIAARNDFAEFLDVLKARCDVWQMEGDRDWRREVEQVPLDEDHTSDDFGNAAVAATRTTTTVRTQREQISTDAPTHYHVSLDTQSPTNFDEAIIKLNPAESWTQTDLTVYGRVLKIASTFTPSGSIGQIHMYSFQALCGANLGPADYISIASAAHTIIIHSIPVLTSNLKNEARRLITLLDALYEARCRLLISAAAPPDSLFFPELQTRFVSTGDNSTGPDAKQISTKDTPSTSTAPDASTSEDSVYQESFSEIYQESTAPFRPNVSSYQSSSSTTSTRRPLTIDQEDTSARPTPSLHNPTLRSILADEDSDFGPTYGNGRSHGASAGQDINAHSQSRFATGPDFTQTSNLTGSDERFAYRRARSRLWEMCGRKWWDARRDEDVVSWWTPVREGERPWESSMTNSTTTATATGNTSTTTTTIRVAAAASGGSHDGSARKIDSSLFPPAPRVYPSTPDTRPTNPSTSSPSSSSPLPPNFHGPKPRPSQKDTDTSSHSPYRVSEKPPPSFGPEHAWGVTTWGRKAGEWGKGVEGDRRKGGDATEVREPEKKVGDTKKRGGKKEP